MSTLGVSRSGRVRKKSAKAVEMDGLEEGDERRKLPNATEVPMNGQTVSRVMLHSQRHPQRSLTASPNAMPFTGNLPIKRPMQVTNYNDDEMDSSSSLSSDSEDSEDSSDNDSDSDGFSMDRVNAHQVPHVPLQDLNKLRRKALPVLQRRQPPLPGDPPYNPKANARPHPLPKSNNLTHRRPNPRMLQDSDLSSNNDDSDDSDDDDLDDDDSDSDSDDDTDSCDSLVIAEGDGSTKRAPLRKLTLPIATATALANAQRQQAQKKLEINEDDELSDDANDKDDDDFIPSNAKKRRTISQISQSPKPKVSPSKPDSDQPPKKNKTPSAYVMFCTETRRILLAENPNLTFSELSKRMGKMWNVLPEKDKQLWRRKAKALQERNASGLISTGKAPSPPKAGKQPMKQPPLQKPQVKAPQAPAKTKPATIAARLQTKQTIQTETKPLVQSGAAHNVPLASKVQSVHMSPSSSSGRLAAKISNYQDLLDQPIETPPRPFGLTPLDAAAHLRLLGDSLTTIGTNLMAHQGPIAVSGSLSVLLDSTLCALGPLVCLTTQLDEMDGSRPETLKKILNNIAYIMPGL